MCVPVARAALLVGRAGRAPANFGHIPPLGSWPTIQGDKWDWYRIEQSAYGHGGLILPKQERGDMDARRAIPEKLYRSWVWNGRYGLQ